jgi:hypothetical protein
MAPGVVVIKHKKLDRMSLFLPASLMLERLGRSIHYWGNPDRLQGPTLQNFLWP